MILKWSDAVLMGLWLLSSILDPHRNLWAKTVSRRPKPSDGDPITRIPIEGGCHFNLFRSQNRTIDPQIPVMSLYLTAWQDLKPEMGMSAGYNTVEACAMMMSRAS